MATLAYPYEVRDSANTSTDNRKAGLTPTVGDGKTLAATPSTVTAAGNVAVVELGHGIYAFLYDAEANGDAAFPVDWGSSLTSPNDRYGNLLLTRDAGRILTALPAAAPGAANGLPALDGQGKLGVESVAQPVTLTAAYDPAKTAAQPGDAMTLDTAQTFALPGGGTAAVLEALQGGYLGAFGDESFAGAGAPASTATLLVRAGGATHITFEVGLDADGNPISRTRQ